MIKVRVRTYRCEGREQPVLQKLTDDELAKPKFPKKINVLIRKTKDALTVIAIEPIVILWDWDPNFEKFRVSEERFSARF